MRNPSTNPDIELRVMRNITNIIKMPGKGGGDAGWKKKNGW